jgi:hypothetical protein
VFNIIITNFRMSVVTISSLIWMTCRKFSIKLEYPNSIVWDCKPS